MFPTICLLTQTTEEYRADKKARGLCKTWRCRRRNRAPKKLLCPTCDSRLQRLRHADRYAFENLRSSARKRGIPFLLTFEEFMEFCSTNEYVAKRGKDPDSLSIDRRDETGPYSKDNIRVMTYGDNISHRREGEHRFVPPVIEQDETGEPY